MTVSPEPVATNAPRSATPPAAPPPINELKRKASSAELDVPQEEQKPIILPPGANLPQGEYEAGRVICEVCGGGVSFRDEPAGGGFTLKHWDAHRLTCGSPSAHPKPSGHQGGGSNTFAPDSASAAYHHHQHHLASPPTKRRRAKRTEEERIDYLRADPYVAKFEAYRVLCASCDKWIRLRPNSTYCSIPWDAHRKSCLAKKTNTKNVYALEERNSLFAKDPDVRKFDAERLLCNMCDKWLSINPDDHLQAVQCWLQHRASCQKTVSALKNVIANMPPDAAGPSNSASAPNSIPTSAQNGDDRKSWPGAHHQRGVSGPNSNAHPHSPPHASSAHPSASTHRPAPPHPPINIAGGNPNTSNTHPGSAPTHLPLPSDPHLLLDLSPANYAAPHESRRRNAEQRAATLRSDILIREVEPNRVFCSLCQKWVQLRQDSSYCAYPWLQHRGKCLARYQRRAQKASEIAHLNKPSHKQHQQQHQYRPRSADDDAPEPESEEGVDSAARGKGKHRAGHHPAPRHQHHSTNPQHQTHAQRHGQQHPPRAIPPGYAAARWAVGVAGGGGEGERDAEGEGEGDDVDADGDSYMEEDGTPGPYAGGAKAYNANGNGGDGNAMLRRAAVPASLADLDSQPGRRHFVFSSVDYLFRTTYEASDDMSISSLLTYLNAAMPQDKHEDFDTGEVIRAASALAARETRRFVLEGDMLRLLTDAN
ncbi:hypothetical protein C8J57DRAFT_1222097 [Mycena rebaudengoi]|nr:hypothetical protein C8J57DRAFT_1222097 [Mycena rebaudengoi]